MVNQVTYMDDLPEPVQEELRFTRNSIEGWAVGTHATPEQWMEFYSKLGGPARLFIIENLLHLAQQGSICEQADHASGVEASWNQLTEVVKLHNARVDEVTMLRAHIEGLKRLVSGAESLAYIQERVDHPSAQVELPAEPGPNAEFLPVTFDGELPTDRRLYVVRDAAEVEDGA